MTPALDRATEALPYGPGAMHPDDRVKVARAVVSAALEVDVMARALAKRWWDRNAGDTDLWDDLTEAEQANVITNTDAADLADAVRAAILGETKNNEREN